MLKGLSYHKHNIHKIASSDLSLSQTYMWACIERQDLSAQRKISSQTNDIKIISIWMTCTILYSTYSNFYINAFSSRLIYLSMSALNSRTDVARNIFFTMQTTFLLTYAFIVLFRVNHGRFMLYNLFEIKFHVMYTPSFHWKFIYTKFFLSNISSEASIEEWQKSFRSASSSSNLWVLRGKNIKKEAWVSREKSCGERMRFLWETCSRKD